MKRGLGLILLVGGLFLVFLLKGGVVLGQEATGEATFLSQIEYTPRLLPGNPFYFLKQWREKIELFLARAPEKRVAKRLEIANRRLAELRVLSEKRPTWAPRLAEQYRQQLEAARRELERLREEKRRELAEHLSEVTLKHQEILLRVYQQVPEEAQKGIETALEESLKGHQKVIEKIEPQGEESEEFFEKLERKKEEIIKKVEEMEEKVEEEEKKEKLEEIKEKMRAAPLEVVPGEVSPPSPQKVLQNVRERGGRGKEE